MAILAIVLSLVILAIGIWTVVGFLTMRSTYSKVSISAREKGISTQGMPTLEHLRGAAAKIDTPEIQSQLEKAEVATKAWVFRLRVLIALGVISLLILVLIPGEYRL